MLSRDELREDLRELLFGSIIGALKEELAPLIGKVNEVAANLSRFSHHDDDMPEFTMDDPSALFSEKESKVSQARPTSRTDSDDSDRSKVNRKESLRNRLWKGRRKSVAPLKQSVAPAKLTRAGSRNRLKGIGSLESARSTPESARRPRNTRSSLASLRGLPKLFGLLRTKSQSSIKSRDSKASKLEPSSPRKVRKKDSAIRSTLAPAARNQYDDVRFSPNPSGDLSNCFSDDSRQPMSSSSMNSMQVASVCSVGHSIPSTVDSPPEVPVFESGGSCVLPLPNMNAVGSRHPGVKSGWASESEGDDGCVSEAQRKHPPPKRMDTFLESPALMGLHNRRGYLAAEENKYQAQQKEKRTRIAGVPRAGSVTHSHSTHIFPSSEARSLSSESCSHVSTYESVKKKVKLNVMAVVETPEFDSISAIAIVLNAIMLGVQTDIAAKSRGEDEDISFIVIEKIFFLIFTAELLMRLTVYGTRFFWSQQWRWNLFDFLIVGIQVVEEITFIIAICSGISPSATGDDESGGLSVLRVLRVLRLVRIVRLARVLHLIGELRTIIVGIFSSMQSLFWTLVLLFLVIYILAVYITQTVTSHLASTVHFGPHENSLEKFYGSLTRSILTLYQAITGGISWKDAVDPLIDRISGWVAFIFTVYIGFSIFCLMNIATGVFVESALETAKNDKEIFLLHHAHEVFEAVDIDGSGTITKQEFLRSVDTPEMQLYFKVIDLDPEAAEDLFIMMDHDNSNELDCGEFVDGCLRLRGPAKAIDLASFAYEHNVAKESVKARLKKLQANVDWIGRNMMKRPRNDSSKVESAELLDDVPGIFSHSTEGVAPTDFENDFITLCSVDTGLTARPF